MRYLVFLPVIILFGAFYFYMPIIPVWGWINGRVSQEQQLILENESLKAQLAELLVKSEQLKVEDVNYVTAKIYSTYPFNDKHIFTIAAGADQKLSEFMPVLVAKNILLGKILKVFNNYSEVKSIFSPDWQMPVKIGGAGVDGLLIGGPNPKVTMIVSDKEISVGEEVYSTGKEFPHGLKIGKVRSVQVDTSSFFKEALIDLPYDFNNLQEVWIFLKK